METRLAELRKKKKLSQEELAKQLGTNRYSVSRWEDGSTDVSLPILLKLADFFEVTIDYFLKRESYNEKPNIDNEPPICKITGSLNGKPVYSIDKGWLLINIVGGYGIDKTGKKYPIDEIGDVYGNSPDYYPNLIRFNRPLDLEKVKEKKDSLLWVEPLQQDEQINLLLRGYYRVESDKVVNDFGLYLYFATYGNQWVAFERTQPDAK